MFARELRWAEFQHESEVGTRAGTSLEACLVVLRRPPGREDFAPRDTYRVEVPNFGIHEAIERVGALLAGEPEGDALGDFLPSIGKQGVSRQLKVRVALASTFEASLELSRQRVLEADQPGLFGEVTLRAI